MPPQDDQKQIRKCLSLFTYFKNWDDDTVRECCDISKVLTFAPDQIVISGKTHGRSSYVYFITEGFCNIYEYVTISNSHRSFVKVCTLRPLACFNLGENLKDRQVVSVTETKCLIIPFYWLIERNEANIWVRTRHFLDWKIPKTERLVSNVKEEVRWRKYKKELVAAGLRRRIGNVNVSDVPYTLRIVARNC